jgi:tetratricopeptide (TPR) repeat protein
VLEVDPLSRPESVALLRERIPDITDTAADELAELVGDLPLALEQAAGYVESTGVSVADYLGLFRTRRAAMLAEGTVVGYEYTLATAWDMSFQRVAAERPAALDLLTMCAYLAPDAIPLDLFVHHPQHLPPALRDAVADPLAWTNTTGALVGYALVKAHAGTLALHRLLRVAASRRDEHRAVHRRVLDLLVSAVPDLIIRRPTAWPAWERLLPHVLAAVENAPPEADAAAAWLLNHGGTYLRARGQWKAAVRLIERALAINEAHTDRDADIAFTLNNLAATLHQLGGYSDALPLHRRALEIYATLYGADHRDVVITRNDLGRVLCRAGELDEAEAEFRRALAVAEQAFPPDDPIILATLNNYAVLLNMTTRAADAERVARSAVELAIKAHGPRDPTVAIAQSNLAQALFELGRPDEARELFESTLAINENVYGPTHPEIAHSLRNLAAVLKAVGRTDEAAAHLTRALRIDRINADS